MRITAFFISFLFCAVIFGQTETHRWGKKEISYTTENKEEQKVNRGFSLLGSLKWGYSFFISDHDGDNCPFYPTCSEFFVQAVRETNFFQGFFMFADRFTRDTNLLKGMKHYPLHVSERFYDPVCNYKLEFGEIKYFPSTVVID